jgi:UrcA family protein
MKTMKTFSELLGGAGVVALLAVPVIAMAAAVHAEPIRIHSGDLSRADRAVSFQQDVNAAADTLCAGYIMDAAHSANVRTCRTAVRDEAMSQLTPSQREQLVASEPSISVASAR